MNMSIEPASVQIRKEKPLKMIYLRHTGAYKGDEDLFSDLFQRLYQWAAEREIVSGNSRWFVIYHDFGNETEEEQLRLSVCMSIDRNVAVSGEIGILSLHEGKYAVGDFWVESSEYQKAWHYMYADWLPESGYKPDDRFALEHYPPSKQSGGKHRVEIYIPIVKI